MDKKIAISIGHYPAKRGASYNGLIEHELASEWVNMIFDVYDSIYDFDRNPPPFELIPVPIGTLREKVAFINSNDFDYAIELHFNSVAGIIVSGSETLYMPNSERGFQMAAFVQEAIAPALGIRDRGVKEGLYWSSRERTNTPLFFLRRTNCPAVIIEPNFLSSYYADRTDEKIVDFSFALLSALGEIAHLNV